MPSVHVLDTESEVGLPMAIAHQPTPTEDERASFREWFSRVKEDGTTFGEHDFALAAWVAASRATGIDALRKDAERYRWLCGNNFDRDGVTQVSTWLHTWEPHSRTGEPVEWIQRVRGGRLDAVIDAAMAPKA